jgi:hypothetical protein
VRENRQFFCVLILENSSNMKFDVHIAVGQHASPLTGYFLNTNTITTHNAVITP